MINPTQRRVDNQGDVRIDHSFGDANRTFVRYSVQNATRYIPPALPNGDGGPIRGTYEIKAHSIAFNDMQLFGSQWLNEFRVGWSGIDLGFIRYGFGQNTADELGIPGINLDARTSGMPTIGFATMDMRSVGARRYGNRQYERVPDDQQRDARPRTTYDQSRGELDPAYTLRLFL